eukprot:m.114461 g.114461  ORF g.114461 m.114461 type:complete len:692 (+) comp16298_c0_seq1:319-2394(+)
MDHLASELAGLFALRGRVWVLGQDIVHWLEAHGYARNDAQACALAGGLVAAGVLLPRASPRDHPVPAPPSQAAFNEEQHVHEGDGSDDENEDDETGKLIDSFRGDDLYAIAASNSRLEVLHQEVERLAAVSEQLLDERTELERVLGETQHHTRALWVAVVLLMAAMPLQPPAQGYVLVAVLAATAVTLWFWRPHPHVRTSAVRLVGMAARAARIGATRLPEANKHLYSSAVAAEAGSTAAYEATSPLQRQISGKLQRRMSGTLQRQLSTGSAGNLDNTIPEDGPWTTPNVTAAANDQDPELAQVQRAATADVRRSTLVHTAFLSEFLFAHGLDLAIAETARGPLAVVDDRLMVVFVNDDLCDLLGRDRTSIVSAEIRDLVASVNCLQQLGALLEERRAGSCVVTLAQAGGTQQCKVYLTPLPHPRTHSVRLFLLAVTPLVGTRRTPKFCGGNPESNLRFLLPTSQNYYGPGATIPIQTDWFRGVMLPFVRGNGNDLPSYFDGKKRAFELQFQGKFLREPRGELWFGVELEQPPKMGHMRRVVSGVLLKFIKAFGRGLHYSFGDSGKAGDQSHLAFPLASAMDCLLVTPEGEVPPPLGMEIPRTPRPRPPSTSSTFHPGPTFTFSIFTRFLDLEGWRGCNLPGFGTVELTGFWQSAVPKMIVYCGGHNKEERFALFEIDVAHRTSFDQLGLQ